MKFKVVDYSERVDGGWRWATINDVRSSMDAVKKELRGKEWHICALQDGSVGGPGYNHEIKREVKQLGHKLLVKSDRHPTVKPASNDDKVKFKIVEYHKKIDSDWRMATISDVNINMEKVKKELKGKEWHICALQDGNIGGSGYDYEIKAEVKELGHKLIIKGNEMLENELAHKLNIKDDGHPTVKPASKDDKVKFKIVEYHKKIDSDWRMATISDVRIYMEKVKKELEGKEWHICALQDGNIGGSGYDYAIKAEVKELGHKLIIKGKPYPTQQNYAYPPAPMNNGYPQPAYNPAAYPPQQVQYPPGAQVSGAYPPTTPGPPPPYYPVDQNRHQAAYPPMQASYPPQPQPHQPEKSGYPPAPYPQNITTGSYDPAARFGVGATQNIPPPPPGVMPNAAQLANMNGQPVLMQQQTSHNFMTGPPGGGMTFW